MDIPDKNSVSNDFTPGKHIHSYPLDDELLLFDELTKQMFRMNPTATAIWKGFSSGIPFKEIVSVLSKTTGTSAEQISEDINHIISHWRSMGFFTDSREVPVVEQQSPPVDQDFNLIGYHGPTPEPPVAVNVYKYKILDICFQLSVPKENDLQIVSSLLTHLTVPHETEADEYLYITRSDGRYILVRNKKIISWCFDVTGIVPMLYGHSLLIAYELSHCLFSLHAAAVLWQGKCVLMPALSGSGKSTLTAALIGSGACLCADDIVMLTPPPVRMRPVSLVIGIKSGSWDLLKPYLPNIESFPIHLRTDEKYIRYVVPDADTLMPMTSKPFPVDVIVFPKFVHNSDDAAVINEINAAEGLCRLTAAGYDIRGKMTEPCVRQLVDWIKHLSCYELRFNQLDKAVSALKTLVS